MTLENIKKEFIMKRNFALTIFSFLIFVGLYGFMLAELHDKTKQFTEAAETVEELSELLVNKEEEIANLKRNQFNLEQKTIKNSASIFILTLGMLKNTSELSEIKNRLNKLENTQPPEDAN